MAKPETDTRRDSSRGAGLSGSRPLDRNSFVPLYFQLAEVLKEKLETGVWQPGGRFPSEREIAEEFSVSRTVIRPALELLEGDGAIVRVKGSGTFVSPPKREVPVVGLVRALTDGGDGLGLTVLAVRRQSPDRTVARFLELKQQRSAPVTHVTAVIRIEDRPVCLVDSYSLASAVPWLLPLARSIAAGEPAGKPEKLRLTRATVSIEGAFFGSWEAAQVGVSAGDPTLMGRLVQFGRPSGEKQEQPIEFARLVYRSDSAQLAIELS